MYKNCFQNFLSIIFLGVEKFNEMFAEEYFVKLREYKCLLCIKMSQRMVIIKEMQVHMKSAMGTLKYFLSPIESECYAHFGN